MKHYKMLQALYMLAFKKVAKELVNIRQDIRQDIRQESREFRASINKSFN